MIADDEPKIRQGLKSVLEEMKLPITVCAEARNGMEALEKIEQFQPRTGQNAPKLGIS